MTCVITNICKHVNNDVVGVTRNGSLCSCGGNETCAVTTGLLGLSPSQAEFDRALLHMNSLGDRAVYDGGDQEFWRKFYTWNELPNRYQAHQALNMPYDQWHQVRVLHTISGLRDVSRIPKDMRHLYTYIY